MPNGRPGGGGGGGGGGILGVGNPFTGAASALEIVGNHGYAYSGQFGTEDVQSLTEMLSFTSGNFYFVGEWTVCGSVNITGDSDTGGIDQFYLSYNAQVIQSLKTDTQHEQSPTLYTVPILIPAYTEVVCQGVSELNNNSWVISQSLIGRIYRS